MASSKSYQAVIEKIVVPNVDPDKSKKKHGPYVVTRCREIGVKVTFSLNPEVWQEEDQPEPGMIVVLSKLRKMRAGWRAKQARFAEPADPETRI